MPYKSKAEREAASRMTWTELLAHVQDAEGCNKGEARRQIGAAIADRELSVNWADERKRPFGSSPIELPNDKPPRQAIYWQKCKTKGDRVLEPPPYDRELVGKRTAARLDKKRRFRSPVFRRDQVLLLWRQTRSSATGAAEKRATAICTEALKSDKDLRRAHALRICRQQFPDLSERGFRERVWPQARQTAGLAPKATSGRKPNRN